MLIFFDGLRLKSGFAAVDRNGCAADEGGLLGGDKDNGLGNLLRASEPLQRNPGSKSCLAVSLAAGEATEHVGFNGAWSNDIHPDSKGGTFQRGRLG